MAQTVPPPRRVVLTDRRIATPDRPALAPKRKPVAAVRYVRDRGMLPAERFWVDGDNRLKTPHPDETFSVPSRMHLLAAYRRPKTPEPTMMGACRILNGIDDLKCFRSVLPPDGNTILHPGRLLPGLVQTTQALFGAATCKAGTTNVLRKVAELVPAQAPRYLTHDVTAMSSSLASVYRKTNLGAPEPDDPAKWATNYDRSFLHENGPGRQQYKVQPGTPVQVRKRPSRSKSSMK